MQDRTPTRTRSHSHAHAPISAEELCAYLAEHLEKGIPFPLNVTGVSMVPFLQPARDGVLLVSTAQRKVKRGAILLCRRNDGSLVLHRCLKRFRDGSVRLNGDSQQWCEQLAPECVLAVVSDLQRKGKLIACDRLGYRLLASVWMRCRPIRPFLFRTVAFFRKLFKRS